MVPQGAYVLRNGSTQAHLPRPAPFLAAGFRFRCSPTRLYGPFRSALDPQPPSAPSARSILVAEDHPDSRDALRTLLEACGYRVHVAEDGEEAVQCAVTVRPSLILMDIMMPRVDGLEAARRLRHEPELQDVPIVALTAMEGGRERAMAGGFNDFVGKPIDLPTFFRKLEHWLNVGRPAST